MERELIVAVVICALIGGSYVGSYIITVLSRRRNKEPIRFGYSHCEVCQRRLEVRHVIPIWSYIYYKGKCPHCHTSIGIETLLWETGFGLLFVAGLVWLFYSLPCNTYSTCIVLILTVLPGEIFHAIMQVDKKRKGELK